MTTSPYLGIPYPEILDPTALAADFAALANEIDGDIFPNYSNTTTRNAETWTAGQYASTRETSGFSATIAQSSSSWSQIGACWVVKSADESVTSSTTLQNDNHFVWQNQVAGTYLLDLRLYVTGNPSGAIKVGFTFPASTTGFRWV